jgi:predicted ATPase/GAF domain-containing protein
MESFPGYKHLETVQEFPESTIFRAQSRINDRPVLLKHFKSGCSKSRFAKLKRLFSDINNQRLFPVSKPLRLMHVKGNVAMSWNDSGEMFLSVILKNTPLDLGRFFDTAILITQALGELHADQTFHNDLRPHNILIDEQNGAVSFTGLSFVLRESGDKKLVPQDILSEDVFVYTAPEQTGRINWDIDQKSDLYSLGAVFYEMLTGFPPFNQQSIQERVQSHLVRVPEPIQSAIPECPGIVNQIIMKLLSKSPEDRYQSAFGLKGDLEICRNQFRSTRFIKTFKLAQKDNIERLNIPSKLYGSQDRFVTLIESLNRVCTGSVEMMMVQGKAGMGKTTLINELLGLASQKGAYVGQGKCEREYRDTPYYSLIKAFQMLIRKILKEEKTHLDKWKDRFSEALGTNGKLVIDFIPELEAITGPQPPVPDLDADEAQNRLNHTFRKFIQTFTMEGNPLVIFLDGFQWVDLASIQLIQAALSDVASRYIMLIVAYQRHLVSNFHTFAFFLDEIEQSGTSIRQIEVTALNLTDVSLLIEDALSFEQDFTQLAQYIVEKTGGNPYFVKQYLTTLHERKLIWFDPKVGKWIWNLSIIRKEKIPHNVIELMAEKVKSLQPESIEILKIASCLGNQFDLDTLVMATHETRKKVVNLLDEPIEKGLIQLVPQGRDILLSFNLKQSRRKKKKILYQFTHSRVLRATYSLLKAKQRKTIHIMLGRLLFSNSSKKDLEKNAYQIVNQMNQGLQLITKQAERHELARLNLIAGIKSQDSAAFETAWKFFSIGSELLSKSSWEKDYELTKALYLKRSECEYFIGNTEAAEPIFDLLLKHIHTKREKVDVINLKLNLYVKNNNLEEAITIGLNALKSIFSEEIPPNDAEITMVSQIKLEDIHAGLEEISIEKLLFHPEMTDLDKKALLELITNIIPAAYIVKRNLWIFLTLRMIEISLTHGNSLSSAYGYMNYAVILCSGLQDYDNGYAMGQLALDLNSKSEHYSFLISQLNFLFGSYIGHWKKKSIENIRYLKRAYRAGIDYGDYISAALSVEYLLKTQIIVGLPLEEIEKEVKKHQDFVGQLNNPDLVNILKTSQLMMTLKEKDFKPGDSFAALPQSKELLESAESSKNIQMKQWVYLINAQVNYLFYNSREALELIQKSDELIASYSQLAISEHYFYFSLIIIDNYDRLNEDEKKKYWDILRNNHQMLSTLADGCPINFKDKELIISALIAGISGNYIKAGDLFDEAVQTAIDNGFIQNEAIANELAAQYYFSKDKSTIATAYIRKACQAYVKWGAMGKLNHLEEHYPQLLKKRQRFDDDSNVKDLSDDNSIFSELSALVKISQEIADEKVLQNLIEKLLSVLIENTNANKGYFLLEQDSHLKIVAEVKQTEETLNIRQLSVLVEDFHDIAHSVVFYVIRTRRSMVLDDASMDNMFSYNSYIKEKQPKSILCHPIINHDKLNGILYLENPDVSGAFSPKMVEMLTLLISQVSISIENSLLTEKSTRLSAELETSRRSLEKRIQVLEQELQSRIV